VTFTIFSDQLDKVRMKLVDAQPLTVQNDLERGVRRVKCLITGFKPSITAWSSTSQEEVSLSAKPRLYLSVDQVDSGEPVRIEIVAPLGARMKAHWRNSENVGEIPLKETRVGGKSRRLVASLMFVKAGVYNVEAIDQNKSITVGKKLVVRPKIVSVSKIDSRYFMDQIVNLDVEVSEPIDRHSLRLFATDRENRKIVQIDCVQMSKEHYSVSFNTSKFGEGTHDLLFLVEKAGVVSAPFPIQIRVIKGSITIQPLNKRWFKLGEKIKVELLAAEFSNVALINLDTNERQAIMMRKTEQPYVFVGEVVPKNFGRFVVQAPQLSSRRFTVVPELSLRCYRLEKNYWKLSDKPAQYDLALRMDSRIRPSEVIISFSGNNHNISLDSFKALEEKNGIKTYRIPLSEVVPEVSSLAAGKYFVQVRAPFASRKCPFTYLLLLNWKK